MATTIKCPECGGSGRDRNPNAGTETCLHCGGHGRIDAVERHRVGTIYSCDARNFGADLRLCPLHAAAEEMRVMLGRLLDETPLADEEDGAHEVIDAARALRARVGR